MSGSTSEKEDYEIDLLSNEMEKTQKHVRIWNLLLIKSFSDFLSCNFTFNNFIFLNFRTIGYLKAK